MQWIDNKCKTLLEENPEQVIEAIKNFEFQEKATIKESN
jgi:hypothetical protein